MTPGVARAGLVALVVTSAACAETTIDTTATTIAAGDTTAITVFAPTGSAVELLPDLLDELAGLSARIVDDEGQVEALARVDTLWDLIRPGIEAEQPDLLSGFDSAIDLARRGVERRRPADADKAHNNAASLAAAFTG